MENEPKRAEAAPAEKSHAPRRNEVIAWVLAAGWALAIFAMSAKSGLDLDSGSGLLSAIKTWLAQALEAAAGRPVDPSPIGHFGEYLVFGLLLVNALRFRLGKDKAAGMALIICALYAASDEFHQAFVPGRACDPLDWIVDTIAAAVAVLICMAFTHLRAMREVSDG